MAQLFLKRPLFRNVNNDDFTTIKISMFVKGIASAEPGFQDGAVFPLPLYFDWLDSGCLGEASRQWISVTKIRDNLGRAVRRKQLLFAFIPKHRQERLVNVQQLSSRFAPA